MAKCKDCGQEMLDGKGCTVTTYINRHAQRLGQGPIKRIAHNRGEGNCHDCGVPQGAMHHPGCDMEACPICGGQLISCNCWAAPLLSTEDFHLLAEVEKHLPLTPREVMCGPNGLIKRFSVLLERLREEV